MSGVSEGWLAKLQTLESDEFEQLIAEIWEQRGWNTQVTSDGRDRGIDVIAERSNPYPEKVLIQAKRYARGNRVGSAEIQQYASLRRQEAGVDQIIVVTSSGFTDPALNRANDLNVKCIDGRTFCSVLDRSADDDLLVKYGLQSRQEPGHGTESVGLNDGTTEDDDEPSHKEESSEAKILDYSGFFGGLRLLKDIFVIPIRAGYIGAQQPNTSPKNSSGQLTSHSSSGVIQHKTSRGGLTVQGESVTVELGGLKDVQTSLRHKGGFASSGDEFRFEGVMATFTITVTDSEPMWLDESNQVTVIDSTGNENHPLSIDGSWLPSGWETHQGRSSIEFVPGSTTNYLAACPTTPNSKVEGIKLDLGRWGGSFEVDAETRTQLKSLPADLEGADI